MQKKLVARVLIVILILWMFTRLLGQIGESEPSPQNSTDTTISVSGWWPIVPETEVREKGLIITSNTLHIRRGDPVHTAQVPCPPKVEGNQVFVLRYWNRIESWYVVACDVKSPVR